MMSRFEVERTHTSVFPKQFLVPDISQKVPVSLFGIRVPFLGVLDPPSAEGESQTTPDK